MLSSALGFFVLVVTTVQFIFQAESINSNTVDVIANVSTRWVNDDASMEYDGGNNFILKNVGVCGLAFYRYPNQGYLLAIVMLLYSEFTIRSYGAGPPVWLANRNLPNAALTFTDQGDLVLTDEHIISVWSTNTADNGVVTMELHAPANLVLLDNQNRVVWQSFDHPAYVLMQGQRLTAGMKLTSVVSSQDPSPGPYTMEMKPAGLFLYANASPPQPYWSRQGGWTIHITTTPFMIYLNGSILLFITKESADLANGTSQKGDMAIDIQSFGEDEGRLRFLKLDPDGALRQYYFHNKRQALRQYYFTNGTSQKGDMAIDIQSFGEDEGRLHYLTLPLSYLQGRLRDPDGALRQYYFHNKRQDEQLVSVFFHQADQYCSLPSSCGQYGLCYASSRSCSCSYASSHTETPIVDELVYKKPELGCSLTVPLTCNLSSRAEQYFIELPSTSYFSLKEAEQYFIEPVPSLTSLTSLSIDIFYAFTTEWANPINKSLKEVYDEDVQAVNSSNDCKRLCLENCSCKAAFFNSNKSTCYTVNEELYTMSSSDTLYNSLLPNTTAYIKLQQRSSLNYSSTDNSIHRSSKKPVLRVVVLLPLTFGVTITVILIATLVYRRKVAKRQEEKLLDAMPGFPKQFSYQELSSVTSNFSSKLGRGGFGSVFKGTFQDGSEVAVKRLESAVQGHKEFRTEVETIGSIHHVNVVQLRGFCAETDHRLLVYEHVANGSLDKWLFRTGSETAVLSWEARVRIALGTARGLAYLHEECRQRIIHLDIKPENILLDESFDAKVCDFGMSKMMKREESEVFTMMRGTRGYMAPEWLQSSITEKADVYSFGVVLLELVSGQRCLDNDRVVSSQRYFPSWASQLAQQGRLAEIIDGQLHQEVEVIQEQAILLVRLALHCLEEDPVQRPSMGSLVQMLEQLMVQTT